MSILYKIPLNEWNVANRHSICLLFTTKFRSICLSVWVTVLWLFCDKSIEIFSVNLSKETEITVKTPYFGDIIWPSTSKRKVLTKFLHFSSIEIVAFHRAEWEFCVCCKFPKCVLFSFLVYENLVNEYEIVRKALLENNLNITKRIISDIKFNTETILNFMPNEENSLLYMYVGTFLLRKIHQIHQFLEITAWKYTFFFLQCLSKWIYRPNRLPYQCGR